MGYDLVPDGLCVEATLTADSQSQGVELHLSLQCYMYLWPCSIRVSVSSALSVRLTGCRFSHVAYICNMAAVKLVCQTI